MPRSMAPLVMRRPVAAVDPITPPVGPRYEGGFSFVRTVQPVLDRYCIGCHGLGKTEKGVNLLGTRGRYNTAHDSLTGRGLVTIAYRNRETGSSRPMDYFAHAGKLVKVIREKHKDRVRFLVTGSARIPGKKFMHRGATGRRRWVWVVKSLLRLSGGSSGVGQ